MNTSNTTESSNTRSPLINNSFSNVFILVGTCFVSFCKTSRKYLLQPSYHYLMIGKPIKCKDTNTFISWRVLDTRSVSLCPSHYTLPKGIRKRHNGFAATAGSTSQVCSRYSSFCTFDDGKFSANYPAPTHNLSCLVQTKLLDFIQSSIHPFIC